MDWLLLFGFRVSFEVSLPEPFCKSGILLSNMDPVDLIWRNGEFVAWEDAQTHVLSHGLHYGTGVFEGIRCYDTPRGPAVFRHHDHLDRLEKSAELYYLELPYSAEEIRQATHELLRRNGLNSA